MGFSENVRALRRRSGISQDELAEQLGYRSFTTVQKWEDGTSNPPYRVLEQIAALFGVSTDSLMNADLTAADFSAAPILGTVRGGAPILAQQHIEGYEPLGADDPRGPDYFYLRVVGDSMKGDRILPGDLVYVHAQSDVEDGQIGVVLVDEEATIKRVYRRGGSLILQPSNPAFQPIVFTPDDLKEHRVQILGRVLSNKIRY